MNAPVRLTHSYSSIKQFENCPKRYFHQRIEKSVKDEGGEAAIYGEQVHKALEDYVRDKKPLPAPLKKHQLVCDTLMGTTKGADVTPEIEMTLNENLKPTGWWDKDAWIRSKLDVLAVKGHKAVVLDWKGLALSTAIPTPTGWTTMAEVAVGDQVLDMRGQPCNVVGKSQTKNVRCYEVEFSDTTKVVCDEEHLWITTEGVFDTPDPKLVGRQVPNAMPLDLPPAALPIHPYVLGLWIADGKHTSAEVSKPDEFIWEKIQNLGYELGSNTGSTCPTRTVKGIRGALVSLGVLGNKHIPTLYLRASIEQRQELLRGLMDGDGNVNSVRKQCIFTTTDPRLSDQVCELLCSLGQRPLKSQVTARGFGKEVQAYPVSFRPVNLNPFSLPRKADRVLSSWGVGHSAWRKVKSVKEIASVPTQCIKVDSLTSSFLCTERMVPTHNTGKRRPDTFQLELFSLQVFAHYENVEKVYSSFVWLPDQKTDMVIHYRDEAARLWEETMSRIKRIEDAQASGNWPAKPSGLCGYCPCKSFCEFSAARR